jgi:RHS repeat-associated protein
MRGHWFIWLALINWVCLALGVGVAQESPNIVWTRFNAHSGAILATAFSADGNFVATAGADGNIKLWNAANGEPVITLTGHTAAVSSVAFSPDGVYLASGSWDRTIRIWRVADGSHLFTLQGHTASVTSVQFTPDGARLVSASWDQTVRVWDFINRRVERILRGHTDWVHDAVIAPNGALVASAGRDGKINVWRIRDGALQHTFEVGVPVFCVAFSPDASTLVSGSWDYAVRYWNLPTNTLTETLQEHTDWVTDIAFASDGSVVLSAGWDQTLRAWAGTSGVLLNTFTQGFRGRIRALNFSPEGTVYAFGTSEGQVAVAVNTFTEFGLRVTSVAPAVVHQQPVVDLTIGGSGFEPNASVRLERDNTTVNPTSVQVLNSFRIRARFDFTNVAPGRYTVVVRNPNGREAALTNGLEVRAGEGTPSPFYEIQGTIQELRENRNYTVDFVYGNFGTAPMDAPLFVLRTDPPVPMRLSNNEPWRTEPILILATGRLVGGRLMPGESVRIPVQFRSETTGNQIQLIAEQVTQIDPALFQNDWAVLRQQLRPIGVDEGIWQQFWRQFVSLLGSNQNAFLQALRQAAALAVRNGQFEPRVEQLILYAWLHTDSVAVDADSFCFDLAVHTPDVPLLLIRTLPQSIVLRTRPTVYGRGWSHSFDYRLHQPNPERVIITTPSGQQRLFTRHGDQWLAAPGDYATLTRNSDGSWSLREPTEYVLEFNTNGQIVRFRKQERVILTFEYTGNLLTRVVHASGAWIRLTYNAQGILTRAEGSNGLATQYAYQDGLLRTVTLPGNLTITYEYHTAAEGLRSYALRRILYPDSSETVFTYDAQGRLERVSGRNGVAPIIYTRPSWDELQFRDAAGNRYTLRYDLEGATTYLRTPEGRETFITYDLARNPVRIADSLGTMALYDYDTFGNLIAEQNALNITRAYNAVPRTQRLQWMRDGRQQTVQFEYDARGNLARIVYPNNAAEAFSYNASDQITQYINRRGQATQLSYDSRGRLAQIRYADGRTQQFQYDSADRLIAVTDSLTGTTTFSYDARGFLTQVTEPNGRWIRYEYNNAGARTRRQGWDGSVVNYEYDAAGRLARLRDGSGTLIVEYTYNSVGTLQRERFGNGCFVDYEYTPDLWVRTVTHYAPTGVAIARYTYTYDQRGNAVVVQTPLGTYNYTYDAVGQLVGVQYPDGTTVGTLYDAEGNRIAVNANGVLTTYTTNELHQYTSAGSFSFLYDADGNLTRQAGPAGVRHYEWNAAGQLTRVVLENGDVITFVYDAFGRRVQVSYNDQTRYYVYDGPNLYAELDANGNIIARYAHGYGLVARSDARGVFYYGYDMVGNTVLVTGANGVVANQYEYHPFGNLIASSETIPNPFRFLGRYGVMDDNIGLYWIRARYYDPNLGRFISPDPVRYADGIPNLYQYALNNPLIFVDYDGEIFIVAPLVGALVVRTAISIVASGVTQVIINLATGNKWYDGLLGAIFWGAIIPPAAHKIASAFKPKIAQQLLNATKSQIANELRTVSKNSAMEKGLRYGSRTYDLSLAREKSKAAPKVKQFLDNLDRKVDATVDKLIKKIEWSGTAITTLWSYLSARRAAAQRNYQIRRSYDPNEKAGPAGYGAAGWIAAPTESFVYDIYFENLPTASAWAQEVRIVDYLDIDLDRATFELLDIDIGGQIINDLAGTQGGRVRVPLRDSDLVADIEVRYNPATGQVVWTMRSIDPLTDDFPPEVDRGLLPPNDPQTGRGQGRASFRIAPRRDRIRHGTQFTNQARIFFDENPPIDTNIWVNTIDTIPPVAEVSPTTYVGSQPIRVQWSGSDVGSGVRDYTVYVSANGDPYRVWLANTTATEATFNPPAEGIYVFAVVARDHVGNRVAPPRIAVDVNGDGCVDDADLLLVLFNFGSTVSTPADITGDGIVDDADLLLVLFNFGRGCGG